MHNTLFFHKLYLCFCLIPALLVFSWTPSQAEPREVVVFPDSARVTGQVTVSPIQHLNRSHVEIILPPQAVPQTITFRPVSETQAVVTDIAWEQTDPPEAALAVGLQKEIDELLQQKTAVQISMGAARAGAELWESQSVQHVSDLSQIAVLEKDLSSSLLRIYTEIEELQQQITELDERIKELENRIREITGPENRFWKILAYLSTGDEQNELTFEYSYILQNCGWKPYYRLQAEPGSSLIHFVWEAQVWQSSGQDWTDVDLSLATLEPARELSPRPIPDWIVGPEKARPAVLGRAVTMEMMDSAHMAVQASPVLERTGTFSQWRLGPRSIAAGERPRIRISEETWEAEFTHLIRPGISNQAFIRAMVNMDQAADLPPGEAVFMLEGAVMGKRQLRLTGTEHTLFFGSDPFVSSTMITREKQSGARGIFSNRQTFLWDFLVKIENHHNYPVNIRVEEPKPLIGDERIRAEFDFTPRPDETTENLFIWNFMLEQSQDKELHLNIKMEAPQDMDVNWGWRR